MGLDSIFVLTTRTMHWFIKRGFQPVDPDWLPDARKRKYNWDRRSQVLVKSSDFLPCEAACAAMPGSPWLPQSTTTPRPRRPGKARRSSG